MSFTKRYIESLGLRSSAQLMSYISSPDFTYDKKKKEDEAFEAYAEEFNKRELNNTLTEKEYLERINTSKNL